MIHNLEQSTQAERAAMLAHGMQEISEREFMARVESAGYRFDRADCFSYVNTGNARPYKARCVSNYSDKVTGRSFAHYQERRDARFDQLQAMRFDCFVFVRGRIWEL